MREAGVSGGLAWLAAVLREIQGLLISIPQECWHEVRSRKENKMATDDRSPQNTGAANLGGLVPQLAGMPGLAWIAGWTLCTTAALPAALIAMAPLAAAFLWMLNQGVKAGLWPEIHSSTLGALGFIAGLALALAAGQWILLRRFLPRAWHWFIATAAGLLLYSLVAGAILSETLVEGWDPYRRFAALILPLGLSLGLAQWLYLRRVLPNAYWIIGIDILAAGSVLLAGRTFTDPAELLVLLLPGIVTGVGLWLLLSQSQAVLARQARQAENRRTGRRFTRLAWAGIGLAALVPMFFACLWVYAASQLVLAKNAGVYPTVEAAIVGKNSQGWGGARVVRVENVHASPNSRDSQPHVWFGGAKVYLDRVPQGGDLDNYSSGSFYLHVRDGWVHVPEGAFPDFIGWVMELYNMEGVREWAAKQ
jgi:hypothetical protein